MTERVIYRSANVRVVDHDARGVTVHFLTSRDRSPNEPCWCLDARADQVRQWAAEHFQAPNRIEDAYRRDTMFKRSFQENMSVRVSSASDLLPSPLLVAPASAPQAAPSAGQTPSASIPAGVREKLRQLDPMVHQVLARATTDGSLLVLTGQLSAAEYTKVNRAIEAMGGKWNRKAGGHLFPFPVGPLLEEALQRGAVVDRKQSLQFFATPAVLAMDMVAKAEIRPGDRVLEPQAGLGAIVAPLVATGAEVHAVEIDPHHVDQLRAAFPGVAVTQGDFLAVAAKWLEDGTRFDAIVMNPPFTADQDARHIEAAYALLAPGGRLVALSSPSPFQNNRSTGHRFRDFLAADGGAEVAEVPAGTFHEAGTGVATRLIFKTKPPALEYEPEPEAALPTP